MRGEGAAWAFLIIAGCFEVMWVVGLKYSQGFTRLWPAVFTVLTLTLSIYFLSLTVRLIPIGTAYAIWTGIGSVGAAVLGVILFKEPADLPRFLCIASIVAGIVGLRLIRS